MATAVAAYWSTATELAKQLDSSNFALPEWQPQLIPLIAWPLVIKLHRILGRVDRLSQLASQSPTHLAHSLQLCQEYLTYSHDYIAECVGESNTQLAPQLTTSIGLNFENASSRDRVRFIASLLVTLASRESDVNVVTKQRLLNRGDIEMILDNSIYARQLALCLSSFVISLYFFDASNPSIRLSTPSLSLTETDLLRVISFLPATPNGVLCILAIILGVPNRNFAVECAKRLASRARAMTLSDEDSAPLALIRIDYALKYIGMLCGAQDAQPLRTVLSEESGGVMTHVGLNIARQNDADIEDYIAFILSSAAFAVSPSRHVGNSNVSSKVFQSPSSLQVAGGDDAWCKCWQVFLDVAMRQTTPNTNDTDDKSNRQEVMRECIRWLLGVMLGSFEPPIPKIVAKGLPMYLSHSEQGASLLSGLTSCELTESEREAIVSISFGQQKDNNYDISFHTSLLSSILHEGRQTRQALHQLVVHLATNAVPNPTWIARVGSVLRCYIALLANLLFIPTPMERQHLHSLCRTSIEICVDSYHANIRVAEDAVILLILLIARDESNKTLLPDVRMQDSSAMNVDGAVSSADTSLHVFKSIYKRLHSSISTAARKPPYSTSSSQIVCQNVLALMHIFLLHARALSRRQPQVIASYLSTHNIMQSLFQSPPRARRPSDLDELGDNDNTELDERVVLSVVEDNKLVPALSDLFSVALFRLRSVASTSELVLSIAGNCSTAVDVETQAPLREHKSRALCMLFEHLQHALFYRRYYGSTSVPTTRSKSSSTSITFGGFSPPFGPSPASPPSSPHRSSVALASLGDDEDEWLYGSDSFLAKTHSSLEVLGMSPRHRPNRKFVEEAIEAILRNPHEMRDALWTQLKELACQLAFGESNGDLILPIVSNHVKLQIAGILPSAALPDLSLHIRPALEGAKKSAQSQNSDTSTKACQQSAATMLGVLALLYVLWHDALTLHNTKSRTQRMMSQILMSWRLGLSGCPPSLSSSPVNTNYFGVPLALLLTAASGYAFYPVLLSLAVSQLPHWFQYVEKVDALDNTPVASKRRKLCDPPSTEYSADTEQKFLEHFKLYTLVEQSRSRGQADAYYWSLSHKLVQEWRSWFAIDPAGASLAAAVVCCCSSNSRDTNGSVRTNEDRWAQHASYVIDPHALLRTIRSATVFDPVIFSWIFLPTLRYFVDASRQFYRVECAQLTGEVDTGHDLHLAIVSSICYSLLRICVSPTLATLPILEALRSAVCSFLHDLFVRVPDLLRLVVTHMFGLCDDKNIHRLASQIETVTRMMVLAVPSVHFCIEFLPQLLHEAFFETAGISTSLTPHGTTTTSTHQNVHMFQDTTRSDSRDIFFELDERHLNEPREAPGWVYDKRLRKQIFLIELASHLIQKYPIPKSLALTQQLVDIARNSHIVAPSVLLHLIRALVRASIHFPEYKDEAIDIATKRGISCDEVLKSVTSPSLSLSSLR